jgi:hypothetical protein
MSIFGHFIFIYSLEGLIELLYFVTNLLYEKTNGFIISIRLSQEKGFRNS